ncbi:MAG: glycosyltransferase family 2 protein [Kutzneria sp.]|nr:glycosyltransferase family 2 protein [Kutzneria sp.]
MNDYSLLPRPAKDLLRQHVGRYVVSDLWWRLRFAAQRFAAERAEKDEVTRLATRLHPLPSATVAVVMPTFRRPERLAAAVDSVLGQTMGDFVLLVVDDGGGQISGLRDDPRIVPVALSRNHRSPGLARNVAMRLSRSEFVAFLDDDNIWRSDHLEQSVTALRAGAGLVYTALRRLRADGSEFDVLSRPFNRAVHRDDAWVDINSVVLRRLPGIRFDPWARPKWLHPREDWEFVHRMSAKLRVEHLAVPTVDYLVHSGSYFTDWDGTAIGVDQT